MLIVLAATASTYCRYSIYNLAYYRQPVKAGAWQSELESETDNSGWFAKLLEKLLRQEL